MVDGETINRQTLKHVLDEHAALNDFLVGMELLVVGGDEKNHFLQRELVAKRGGEFDGRGKRQDSAARDELFNLN